MVLLMLVIHELRRNSASVAIANDRLEKVGDQLRGRNEVLPKALSNTAGLVLMIPAILDGCSVERVSVVETEDPLASFVLENKGVVHAMRLLRHLVDPVRSDDHLPSVFHPVDTSQLDQVR